MVEGLVRSQKHSAADWAPKRNRRPGPLFKPHCQRLPVLVLHEQRSLGTAEKIVHSVGASTIFPA
jgi:hypothetical protein